MQPCLGLGVFARYAGAAFALPSLLVSTLAVGWPGIVQAAPTLICVTEVTGQGADGKALLTLPAEFIATRQDGSVIIAVDPTCVGDTDAAAPPTADTDAAAPPTADPYTDARAVIDEVVKEAKKAGVPEEVANRAGVELGEDVEAAKTAKDNPANQVNGANDGRVQRSAENPEDGDEAMIAAIGSVAAVCMVASAGICSAAVAAIIPSILPAKITTKEVQGIASVVNDLNHGRPVSAEGIKTLLDISRKFSNASERDLRALGRLAEDGLKVAAEQTLVENGLKVDQASIVIEAINQAINSGRFDCEAMARAAGLAGPVQVSDAQFVAKVVATVENSRHGAPVAAPVRRCLVSYFDSKE